MKHDPNYTYPEEDDTVMADGDAKAPAAASGDGGSAAPAADDDAGWGDDDAGAGGDKSAYVWQKPFIFFA